MKFFKFVLLFLVLCGGCAKNQSSNVQTTDTTQPQLDVRDILFTGTLAPSEYPSWSTFMSAEKAGYIDGEKGVQGVIEKQYNVDLVLAVSDYDTCIQKYVTGNVDAVCITNIDVLKPSITRQSTVICPTSTSNGADAVIAVGFNDLEDLKGTPVFGLKKSVSEYCYVAALKSQGQNPTYFPFENLDPEAAAISLQSGNNQNVKAICVWNPYALQTLRKNTKSKKIVDSTVIPEQIIDLVVVANSTLQRPGGDRFAKCICTTFYKVNEQLADPNTSSVMTRTLGEDFSNLNEEDMRICLQETSFYSTPDDGIKLFNSDKFKTITTPEVIKTCQEIGILENNESPTIGFDDSSKQLNFSTFHMQQLKKE